MKVPRQVGIVAWVVVAAAAARFDAAAFQLFVVVSLFALIARNLGERRTGPSAYSVFNPGCQPILGQMSAEQFDAEIRHRPTEPIDEPRRVNTRARVTDEDLLESVRREIMQEQRRAKRTMPVARGPRQRR